jgi:DNA polymerase III delta prime subunit
MALNSYIQQTIAMITENRLPHAIIVEAENTADALFYVMSCAKIVLKTDHPENHPDFFTLSPSGKINVIKIEAIRELIDCVQKTPNAGEQKVFVIFEAHCLNKNAANALLKTLEEPPADTILFLLTHSKNFLLPTIISRCALHHLPENPIPILPIKLTEWLDQLEGFLQKICSNWNATNVLEIFSLLETLSSNMGNLTNDSDEVKDVSAKDIQRVFLKTVKEKVWNIFHLKMPIHAIEYMMKNIEESSLLLAVNGSFLHVAESILLQIYAINCSASRGILPLQPLAREYHSLVPQA